MNIPHLKQILLPGRRTQLSVLVAVLLVGFISATAQASSWNPTLLVNTESFDTIDDGDGTTDIELRFGDSVHEKLFWNVSQNRFQLTRDLFIQGGLTATGAITTRQSITASGALKINDDDTGDAVLTFGNDAGDETIQFNDTTNEFDISDDINVTGTIDATSNISGSGNLSIEGTSDLQGNTTVTGTLDTTGNITTDANLTINEDNGDADAVLTFGNDAGAKALTYSNANTRFEFNDDVHITGTLETTSDVTVGGTITLNGVTYTFPASDGSASGKVLKTDSSGQLSWAEDNNEGSFSQALADDRYVNISGDTMTGNLIIGNGKTLSASGNIITESNLTINEDNEGADAVLTFGNDAAAETLTFSDSTNQFELSDDLQVGGNLDVNGDETVSGTLEINDDNSGNATLTFGNDAGDETIIFNDTSNEFDISDDINVTGTIDATSNISGSGVLSIDGAAYLNSTLTVGSTITLGGVTYTFPTSDGSASGKVLATDSSGQLSWIDLSVGTGSGGVVFLNPEYPNAIYTSSGSTYIGQLTYDFDATNKENYYRWTSTKAALQDYWIIVRIRIPNNFSAWDSSQPIEFRYRTGDASAANNSMTMRLFDTGGTEIALTGASNLANTSWTTATVTGPESTGTYTTTNYITLAIKIAANSSGSSDAGYINLNWETTAP